MSHLTILVLTTIICVTVIHASVLPWLPFAPWWVRAPNKDTPPVVNIQRLGGNYAYSTAEGKAFEALVPASVVQPPVAAVHVPAFSDLTVHYLPSGQVVLVPRGSSVTVPTDTDDGGEAGTTTEGNEIETANDPAELNDPEQPVEPAPITEQPEDNEATESL
ncbi:uncharacterized protein LOC131685298 [Topomyia yanbarensis]|uniref:uncharacterized protein LOC131685298 n=1 Tax=Topomyia yanbarensis TaxID=2498891 RepID=UPI00273CF0FB|nr:uncharacterized protein LOC131685298 [Topomyia yanbarensis]